MMAETVLIEVQASTPQNSLGQAKVNADFTMRNQGSASESMSVRFPLASNNGFGEIPEIENLSVKVNGSLVVTRRILQEDPMSRGHAVPWAEFDVTFPPNQDVNILVTYLLEGTGEYPYAAFYYIFRTGAGWKDSIGSADLIVRLPYQASAQNVIFDEHTGWSFTTPGGVIGGQEIRWHFEDFEPDQSNDFEISLVRGQNAHFKILYVPRSKVWHKVSRSTGGTSSGISHYYTIMNMLSCLDTNKPLPFLLRTLRHCSIVCTMLLSLLTQNVSKMAGIKYLYRGAVDYFNGKFGELSYEADR